MPPSVSLFDVEPLYESLACGRLVLTSNRRLATRIASAYVIAARERGQAVVTTPRVYSLKAWISRQWQRLLTEAYAPALEHRLLEPAQEQWLWERIVADTPLGQALLRPAATAQRAAGAYRLIAEWRLDLGESGVRSALQVGDDASVWWQWATAFEAHCRNRGRISAARLPELLIAATADDALAREASIDLVGFQDLPPLHAALLETSGPLQHVRMASREGEVRRVQCESWQQEVQAAAVWSKQILKNDPAATVAIVVPELQQQRTSVERVVREVFEPGYNVCAPATSNAGTAQRKVLPFNMSAGYPLLDAPVIRAVLDLLSLSLPQLELPVFEAICQSPFGLNGAADIDRIAGLISRCREQQSLSLSVARFRQWAADIAGADPVAQGDWAFAGALQQAATLCRQRHVDRPRGHGDWADFFQCLLQLFGWPGQRRLDSIEYQQVVHWQDALKQFVNLDSVVGGESIPLRESISQLRGILSRHVFQPQTADSPLQVLGTLEAAGLQFSHLWLTSMSARHWPPPPSPNPLLPPALQRELGMPHSSAEHEYEYAAGLTHQFLRTARHVVVSAPATVDENPVRFSRLFSAHPAVDLGTLLGRDLAMLLPGVEIRRRYLESRKLETVEAGAAPPLDNPGSVGGGTSLFANQSACPFRAFARHRLHLDSLGRPEPGLSAAERGNLLHRSLEFFWNALHCREALLALEDDALRDHCHRAADHALGQILARSGKHFGERFRRIETERLESLLLAWMAVEKERTDFVVQATEKREAFDVAGLNVVARIDRIDRLADGTLLIIDYKTGRTALSAWWGDRPEQPQLPLYAISAERGHDDGADTRVGGIAFAEISARGCQLKGAGEESCAEPQVAWDKPLKTDSGQYSWERQKQQWRAVLSRLAGEFIGGNAEVDPKFHPQQSPKTCQYCGLQPLCRISHEELNP